MKTLIWILVTALLVCSTTVTAQETIYDKEGNVQGYIKRGEFETDRFELFDENWNRVGYIKQNRFQPDRYDVFDQNWNRTGYLEKTDGRWQRQDNERR